MEDYGANVGYDMSELEHGFYRFYCPPHVVLILLLQTCETEFSS